MWLGPEQGSRGKGGRREGSRGSWLFHRQVILNAKTGGGAGSAKSLTYSSNEFWAFLFFLLFSNTMVIFFRSLRKSDLEFFLSPSPAYGLEFSIH